MRHSTVSSQDLLDSARSPWKPGVWRGVCLLPRELSWRNASPARVHFPLKGWEQLAPVSVVRKGILNVIACESLAGAFPLRGCQMPAGFVSFLVPAQDQRISVFSSLRWFPVHRAQ